MTIITRTGGGIAEVEATSSIPQLVAILAPEAPMVRAEIEWDSSDRVEVEVPGSLNPLVLISDIDQGVNVQVPTAPALLVGVVPSAAQDAIDRAIEESLRNSESAQQARLDAIAERRRIEEYRNEILDNIGTVDDVVRQQILTWGTVTENALKEEFQTGVLVNYYTINGVDTAIAGALTAFSAGFSNDVQSIQTTLETDYYTAAETDLAISNASLTLMSQLESPSGSIGQLTAILGTDYYTVVQADSAIAAATTTLLSELVSPTGAIGKVNAMLLSDYYTIAQVDTAIAAATNTLEASIDDVSATVTSQQIAIATLEGNAEALVAFRTVAGSAGALLELTATSNPDGVASTARIAAEKIILEGSITADLIEANSITSNQIAANTITANKIAAESVTAPILAAGAVTAEKISVGSLSAITATVGLLRTATSGARMEIHSDRILVFDANGNVRVRIGNLA